MSLATPGLWLEILTGGDPTAVDRFYASGRLPALERLPGLRGLHRLAEVDGPRRVVVARLDDVDAVRPVIRGGLDGAPPLDQAPVPQARGLLATEVPGSAAGDDGAPGITFLVAMAVNTAREDEYNRWYDTEHIPILLRHPGWLGARRYRCDSPATEYLTVYRVRDPHIVTPPVRAAVRATEWSREVLSSVFVTHTRAFLSDAGPG